MRLPDERPARLAVLPSMARQRCLRRPADAPRLAALAAEAGAWMGASSRALAVPLYAKVIWMAWCLRLKVARGI